MYQYHQATQQGLDDVNIRIIDNEPRWVNFAKIDLRCMEIVVVSEIDVAMREIEINLFDLVIVSSEYLTSPENILEKIRDEKIVVTTVQPNTREALDAYRKGAKRYIAKSFQEQDLFRIVRELISLTKN